MHRLRCSHLFSFSRFNELIEETGVSKVHIARKLVKKEDQAKYFFRDKEDTKKKTRPLTDEQIAIIAKCLWTTPEYLTGESDQKEILPASEYLNREEMKIIEWYRKAEEFDKGRVFAILEVYEKNNATIQA